MHDSDELWAMELCASDDLSINTLREIINALGPSALSQIQLICFHRACMNKRVTLEMVQLLYNIWPGALRLRDNDADRFLPIHCLCCSEDLDDTASIDILHFMLKIDPMLLREADVDGCLPIHYAVTAKSTTFCKQLIDAYPESLWSRAGVGWLSIHRACAHGEGDDTADIIQYMLEMESELINDEDSKGFLPIHYAAMYGRTKSIELLLKFDLNAASKETNDGSWQLPLHVACEYHPNLSSIQLLYDAYPEAILVSVRDEYSRTPTPIDLMLRGEST